jgi:hypothetical protein
LETGVEILPVFDDQGGHYLLLKVGWYHKKRIRATTVYVRLRNGKFWVEEDVTENGIATDLQKAGVPAEDIVLVSGFRKKLPSLLQLQQRVRDQFVRHRLAIIEPETAFRSAGTAWTYVGGP